LDFRDQNADFTFLFILEIWRITGIRSFTYSYTVILWARIWQCHRQLTSTLLAQINTKTAVVWNKIAYNTHNTSPDLLSSNIICSLYWTWK